MGLSAVIPTIGRENYLALAIESLINQSTPFDEIIVFDNSKEQNLERKLKFSTELKVKFINSGVRLDPISSWNNAVKSCSFEYVVILGDDDVALPNFSFCLRSLLKTSDLVIARAMSIDEFGNKIDDLPYPHQSNLSYPEFFKKRFTGSCSLFVPGMAFKKDLFLRVGGFKNTHIEGSAYSDELLLFSMSFLNRKVSITEELCWMYRVHSGQLAGVKCIRGIVSTSINYINQFEVEMFQIGFSRNNDLYFSLKRNIYLSRVITYRLYLYSVYSARNQNFFQFQRNIIKNLYKITKLNPFSSLKLHLKANKFYLANTHFGQWLKGLIK